jgi:serine phosphatase RsbU (regulator of sigma subunit)
LRNIFYILFLFCFKLSFSQSYLDSLNVKLKNAKNDSVKIVTYYKASFSEKLNQQQKDSLIFLIGELGKNSKLKRLYSYAIFKQGYYYDNFKKYDNALESYILALKEAEKVKNLYVQAICHNRIGDVYSNEKKYTIAIRQYHYSIPIAKLINDSADLSENYNALGTIYKNINQADSSLFYHFKALEIRLKFGKKTSLANSYNNIGLIYKKIKDYDNAINFLNKGLQIRLKLNDIKGVSGSKINIGNVLNLKKEYKEALIHLEEGTKLAYENKLGDFYCNGLLGIQSSLFGLKKYKECCLVWEKYKIANDSLEKEKNNNELQELEIKYNSEKKDAELKFKSEQIKNKTEQNAKQKILIIASVVALLMALIAVIFIYRSFVLNKRNAKQLAIKNLLIEEKNKEITDSINYAKLIQQSLLASETILTKNLKDYFILYKPKDIVSGDFYWATETNNGFLMACVDCTGHGVPGAFMSLIGKENLDKAAVTSSSPKQILSLLNNGVKKSLNQNENNTNRDGMDISLINIQYLNDGKTKIDYAGANRSLLILRKNNSIVEEIKSTKSAIGGFTSNEQEFDETEIILDSGDLVFMSTDGYADQFGSEKNKKMTTKKFKEILLENKNIQISEIENNLETFFTNFKGKLDQVDDVLVIGLRV